MTAFATWFYDRFGHGGILDWLGSILGLLVIVPLFVTNGSLIEPTAAAGSALTFLGINQSGALLAFHDWMVAPIRSEAIRGFLIVVLAACALNFIVADRRSEPRDGPAASARTSGMLLRMASIAWVSFALLVEMKVPTTVPAVVSLGGFLVAGVAVSALSGARSASWVFIPYGLAFLALGAIFAPARIVRWIVAIRISKSIIELDNRLYKRRKKDEAREQQARLEVRGLGRQVGFPGRRPYT